MSLTIFEDRYVQMLNDVMEGSRSFVSVLIERGSEVGGKDLRYQHGVHVVVNNVTTYESLLFVEGSVLAPCTIADWLPDDPYPRAHIQAQKVSPLSESQRYDSASSLTLLAQSIRLIHEALPSRNTEHLEPDDISTRVATIAAGHWWDERVQERDIEQAFWLLARNLPCGPFDRYALLAPQSLVNRVKLLKQTVEHVQEVVAFRFDQ